MIAKDVKCAPDTGSSHIDHARISPGIGDKLGERSETMD
jgi:hypothetical protein